MPIQVGGNVIQQPTLDLATPTYQQRALEQAQWQQAINQVLQSVVSVMKQKATNKQLKDMGVITKKQPTITDYQKLMQEKGLQGGVSSNLTPERQIQVYNQLMQGLGVKPPQPTQTYDWSKVTPGMKITDPTTGMEMTGQKPSLFENMTVSPEGELAIKVGDTFIPLKSVSKSGFSVKGEAKPEITKTAALNILADPIKMQNLSDTQPELYQQVLSAAFGKTEEMPSPASAGEQSPPSYDIKTQKLMYSPSQKKYFVVPK